MEQGAYAPRSSQTYSGIRIVSHIAIPEESSPRQKVVTIYLDNLGQGLRHGQVHEHLASELADGWRVKSVSGIGGISGLFRAARGWFLVVLEKA